MYKCQDLSTQEIWCQEKLFRRKNLDFNRGGEKLMGKKYSRKLERTYF